MKKVELVTSKNVTNCPGCTRMKALLNRYQIPYVERDASEFTWVRAVPQVIVDGTCIEISPGHFVEKMKKLGVI